MAPSNTKLDQFISDEVKKYEGILVPIKAGFPERLFVRKVACHKLHPNPDDEFCFPTIGPSYPIINNYVQTYQRFGRMNPDELVKDTLMVEKTHPDGYMILNGHHRWAAYMQLGIKKIPVSIINLTQGSDIINMLNASDHTKRVTLDLNEVVFCSGEDEIPAEKPPSFPRNKIFRERIRLGIPALLNFLGRQGYDIWVYTADYYSYDYLSAYFKRYSVKVDGIVTGTARKTKKGTETKKKTEQLFREKYTETLHIDNDMILRTFRDGREHEEIELNVDRSSWSTEVIKIIKGHIQDAKE